MKHLKQYLTVGIFTMVTLTSTYAFDVNSSGDQKNTLAQDSAPTTSTQLNTAQPSGITSSSSISSSLSSSEALDGSSTTNTRPNAVTNNLVSNTPNKILSTKSSFNPTLPPFGDDDEEEGDDYDYDEDDEDEDDEDDD